MRRIPWLLALLTMAATLRAADTPFVGDWKLDLSRTRLTDEMKVVNVSADRYAFDFGGGAETVTVDGTDQAAGGGTTLAVSAEGPQSWKVVRKKDGRVLLTAIWNLSRDGNALTDDFTSIASDGSASTVKLLYRRTAGTAGFAGTWESSDARMTSPFVVKIRPFGSDGLSFDSSRGITKNVNFDGREHPDGGPNAPAGLMSSVRRIDEHTIEMTDKLDGRIFDTQEIQLSSDRKTLTMTIHMAGHRQPNVFVFERQ